MAFGNLLLAALTEIKGDFAVAVEQLVRLAGWAANVMPISTADTQLCAELAGGAIVEGELNVRGLGKPPIARLFLREDAPAYPAALDAIRAADLVVLGPGSLFTTLLGSLLFGGVAEALREARGRVVYICNTTTQPGQTDRFSALDHVRRVVDATGRGALDAALINRGRLEAATVARYAAEGLHLLQPDDAEIAAIEELGVRPVVRDLAERGGEQRALWNKQDSIRHDTNALSAALRDILG